MYCRRSQRKISRMTAQIRHNTVPYCVRDTTYKSATPGYYTALYALRCKWKVSSYIRYDSVPHGTRCAWHHAQECNAWLLRLWPRRCYTAMQCVDTHELNSVCLHETKMTRPLVLLDQSGNSHKSKSDMHIRVYTITCAIEDFNVNFTVHEAKPVRYRIAPCTWHRVTAANEPIARKALLTGWTGHKLQFQDQNRVENSTKYDHC